MDSSKEQRLTSQHKSQIQRFGKKLDVDGSLIFMKKFCDEQSLDTDVELCLRKEREGGQDSGIVGLDQKEMECLKLGKSIIQNGRKEGLFNKNKFCIQASFLRMSYKFCLFDSEEKVLISCRQKRMNKNIFYFFQGSQTQSIKNSNYISYMTRQVNLNQHKYFLYSSNNLPISVFIFKKQTNKNQLIKISIHISNGTTNKQILTQLNTSNILSLQNRHPQKDKNGNLYLNLKGLGKISSSSNCSIIYGNTDVLIMGKQKDKIYNLHYGKYWTDLIAMAFAVANHQLTL